MIFVLIPIGVILWLALFWLEQEKIKDDAVLYPRPPNVQSVSQRKNGSK